MVWFWLNFDLRQLGAYMFVKKRRYVDWTPWSSQVTGSLSSFNLELDLFCENDFAETIDSFDWLFRI